MELFSEWILRFAATGIVLGCALSLGCNVTKSRLATEQLVIADAVDHAISQIDFSALSGRKVFFDKSFMPPTNAPGKPPTNSSNVEYVTSSLRQQMLAYNCLLQDKAEDAEVIVEARLGAMGADSNEQTYGLPTGVVLHTAAAAVAPGGGSLPQLPDLSLGRRNHQLGAARIGVFAYDRNTREPVWQAGIATGNSKANDLWVLGIGPFQRGRIYDQVQSSTPEPKVLQAKQQTPSGLANFSRPQTFQRAVTLADQSGDTSYEQPPARILTPQPLVPDGNPASTLVGR
jgi:hypothetical protein